jgi:hypothetical protein
MCARGGTLTNGVVAALLAGIALSACGSICSHPTPSRVHSIAAHTPRSARPPPLLDPDVCVALERAHFFLHYSLSPSTFRPPRRRAHPDASRGERSTDGGGGHSHTRHSISPYSGNHPNSMHVRPVENASDTDVRCTSICLSCMDAPSTGARHRCTKRIDESE